MLTRIGYYAFDTDDIVAACPDDNGPLVNDPTLWHLLDPDADTLQALELGEIVIAFCPTKSHIAILEAGVVLKLFSVLRVNLQ